MRPDDAFAILYGRQPTDADKLRLMRCKDALGLPDDDAIWALLIALAHFQALYEEMPEKISAAAREACLNVSEAAEAQTVARLSSAVAETSERIAGQRAWRGLLLAGAVAIGVFAASLMGAFAVAHFRYEDRLAAFKAETMTRFDKAVESRVAEERAKFGASSAKQR